MTRPLLLVALLGCACEKKAAIDGGELSNAPRASTLKCTLLAPSGWTANSSIMPDHLAEVIATAPGLRGRMVVRETIEGTIGEATEGQKARVLGAWGGQPDFTLLREDPFGDDGRLLAYQWRPQSSAPVERHLIAVQSVESRVVLAFVDDDGKTPESQLLASVGTLRCKPR